MPLALTGYRYRLEPTPTQERLDDLLRSGQRQPEGAEQLGNGTYFRRAGEGLAAACGIVDQT